MDIYEKENQSRALEKETLRIYNPDTEDFTVKFNGVSYTIPALEIAEFPYFVANHIKKHLADLLLAKRGTKTNPEDDLKEIYKEIEVSL